MTKAVLARRDAHLHLDRARLDADERERGDLAVHAPPAAPWPPQQCTRNVSRAARPRARTFGEHRREGGDVQAVSASGSGRTAMTVVLSWCGSRIASTSRMSASATASGAVVRVGRDDALRSRSSRASAVRRSRGSRSRRPRARAAGATRRRGRAHRRSPPSAACAGADRPSPPPRVMRPMAARRSSSGASEWSSFRSAISPRRNSRSGLSPTLTHSTPSSREHRGDERRAHAGQDGVGRDLGGDGVVGRAAAT